MEHYSSTEWADFVLGNDPEHASAMNLHLRTCPLCIDSHQFWWRLAAAVELDIKNRVPTSVIRHLQRAFAIRAKPDGPKYIFPRLSFDSLWEPHPLGVRSVAPSNRTLVFQTTDLELRLRIEKRLSPERFWLDGQLAAKEDAAVVFGHLRTRMVRENVAVAEAFTNEFGEFQFEFAPASEIELSIELGDERVMSIPLDPLHPETEETSP